MRAHSGATGGFSGQTMKTEARKNEVMAMRRGRRDWQAVRRSARTWAGVHREAAAERWDVSGARVGELASRARKARRVHPGRPRKTAAAREVVAVGARVVDRTMTAIQRRIEAMVGRTVREVAAGYVERRADAHGGARLRRRREACDAVDVGRTVCEYLASVARSAGRMAGRGANVSATSVEEAGEAGRARVVAWAMAHGAADEAGLPAQLIRAALRPDSVRAHRLMRWAKSAAVSSLRAGWAGGMTGRATALAALRVGAPEVIVGGHVLDESGVPMGGEHWAERRADHDGPGEPNGSAADMLSAVDMAGRAWGGHRGSLSEGDLDGDDAGRWSRALTLARAVRRICSAELARLAVEHGKRWAVPGGASARAWGRTASATRARFGRVGRVLVRIALGESLELACGAGGFGWHPNRGESSGFSRAVRELGVATGLGLLA